MNKTNKSRELIFKGLTMHLNGYNLKKIYKKYDSFYLNYKFSKQDTAFVKFITLEAISNRGIIEAILKEHLSRPLPKKLVEIKAAMMVGITQILFSKVEPYACVSTTVNLFKGKIFKWRGLANAILRKIVQNKEEFLFLKDDLFINFPEWLLEKWLSQYGRTATKKIIKSFNRGSAIDIKFKSNNLSYHTKIEGIGLKNNTIRVSNLGDIRKLKGYKEGEWWVQDIAAQLPVLCLGDIKNKIVIDLCAAPGGKTCQLLDLGAKVIAVDKSKERLKLLNDNVKRLNLQKNLTTICEDISNFIPKNKASLILLDVPCTSTGTIRKNPDIVWHKNQYVLEKIVETQKQLLNFAIKMLENDGILIYSNCSMEFEEGEYIIQESIKTGLVKLDNIEKNEIMGYPKEAFIQGAIRTLPYMNKEYGGMDGFFIARLKKVSHN